jgi:hypothetical protein
LGRRGCAGRRSGEAERRLGSMLIDFRIDSDIRMLYFVGLLVMMFGDYRNVSGCTCTRRQDEQYLIIPTGCTLRVFDLANRSNCFEDSGPPGSRFYTLARILCSLMML